MKEDKNLEFIIKYKYIIIILMIAGFAFLAAFMRSYIIKETKKIKVMQTKKASKESHCYKKLELKNFEDAMECYEAIGQKDKSLEVKYKYAISLLSAERYDEARDEFFLIARNEKNNEILVNKAKNKIQEIDEYFRKYDLAKSRDYGDYYKNIENNLIWSKTKRLSVYIDNPYSTIGELTQTAFENWSNGTQNLLSFEYVDNKDNADIICEIDNKDFKNSFTKDDVKIKKLKDSKNLISKATIYLHAGNFDTTNEKTKEDYLKETMHKIGHALGITFHSSSKNDIMHENPNEIYEPAISKRDFNTFKRTYNHL